MLVTFTVVAHPSHLIPKMFVLRMVRTVGEGWGATTALVGDINTLFTEEEAERFAPVVAEALNAGVKLGQQLAEHAPVPVHPTIPHGKFPPLPPPPKTQHWVPWEKKPLPPTEPEKNPYTDIPWASIMGGIVDTTKVFADKPASLVQSEKATGPGDLVVFDIEADPAKVAAAVDKVKQGFVAALKNTYAFDGLAKAAAEAKAKAVETGKPVWTAQQQKKQQITKPLIYVPGTWKCPVPNCGYSVVNTPAIDFAGTPTCIHIDGKVAMVLHPEVPET